MKLQKVMISYMKVTDLENIETADKVTLPRSVQMCYIA